MSPRSSVLLNIFEPIDVPEPPPNESPPKEIVAEQLNIFEPMDEPARSKPITNGFIEAMEPPRSETPLKMDDKDRMANHVEIKYKDTVFARKEVLVAHPLEGQEIKEKKEKLSNREELEREKERLRQMIKEMNAKALADKYPVLEKKDEVKLVSPVMEAKITLEPISSLFEEPKDEKQQLGAIKKPTKKLDDPSENSSKDEKPKKVSSSVQTPGILKKPEIATPPPPPPVVAERSNLYENIADSVINVACITSKKEDDSMEKAKYRRQFKSSKGLDSFKASLKFPPISMSSTNTLAVNKLLRSLENAIESGEFDQAANFAMELAKMKVALSVMRQKDRPMSGNWENIT